MSEKQHKKWTILVDGQGTTYKVKTERAEREIAGLDELVDKAIAKVLKEGISCLTVEMLEQLRLKILREED